MAVTPRDKPGIVRVKLHAVGVPHGQLKLLRAAVGSSGCVMPGPAFLRVDEVEVVLQLSRRKAVRVALEVTIDVVGMVLVFDEGSVNENLIDADLSKLPDHYAKVLDELEPPSTVPRGIVLGGPGSEHENGLLKSVQGHRVVAGAQHSVRRQAQWCWHGATLRDALLNIIVKLYVFVQRNVCRVVSRIFLLRNLALQAEDMARQRFQAVPFGPRPPRRKRA